MATQRQKFLARVQELWGDEAVRKAKLDLAEARYLGQGDTGLQTEHYSIDCTGNDGTMVRLRTGGKAEEYDWGRREGSRREFISRIERIGRRYPGLSEAIGNCLRLVEGG